MSERTMKFRKPSGLAWASPVATVLALGAALWANRLDAADQIPDAKQYAEQVRPFLVKHCQECHGKEKPKGDLRLDQLSLDFDRQANRDSWLAVLKRVKTGEMPPKAKPRPSEKEVAALADWINGKVSAATAKRAAEGRVVLRRLNRIEYENTVRDLLGVTIDLQELLPEDTSANGFDNIGEALQVSSFLMEKYLEAADKALNVAIVNGPQPPVINKRYSFKDERNVKIPSERVFLPQEEAVVSFTSSPWQALMLWQFYPPDRGNYRFRISASGFQSAGKPVVYRVDAGPMLMATKNHLVGYYDAPADKPAIVEFTDHLEARSHIRILP